MSDTRAAPQAQMQTASPTWLRWVSGHTLTCAILAWASVTFAVPMGAWTKRLGCQLLLAVLLCVLHGLTIALQQRGGARRALLALAVVPAVLPWLLLVPLTLGTAVEGGTVPRMITLGIVGTLVSLAVQPVPDRDGRQGARIGASALTWALTALADSVLGPTMQLAVMSIAPVAVLSGALSGAIGGLGGAWLAAGAWGAVRTVEQPRLGCGCGTIIGVSGRWLLGCALIGVAEGLVLQFSWPMPMGLWSFIISVALIGAGGGLLLAWLWGEARRLAWRRARRGMYGALCGLLLALYPAWWFMWGYPLTAVLVVAGCVGLCAGVGQDAAAAPGPGRSPWWPVATMIAVSIAWVGTYGAFNDMWRELSMWQLWLGNMGAVAGLITTVLAALAGGLWGLPLVLLAARAWPAPG